MQEAKIQIQELHLTTYQWLKACGIKANIDFRLYTNLYGQTLSRRQGGTVNKNNGYENIKTAYNKRE
jgi:hypothetical protein